FRRAVGVEICRRRVDRDSRRAIHRVAKHAAADRGERDSLDSVLARELERAAVAAREQLGLARGAALPDRPDRVDDVTGRQPEARSDPALAGWAANAGPHLGHGAAGVE